MTPALMTAAVSISTNRHGIQHQLAVVIQPLNFYVQQSL